MKRGFTIPIPMWIALIVAVPLMAMFALSLLAATAIAGVVGAVYMLLRPSAPRRPVPRRRPAPVDEIELDPRDYHRLPNDGSSE